MKTSKFTTISATFAIVGLLFAFSSASAQPGYGCCGHPGMTNEQISDMQQIHRSHWEKMEPLVQQRFAKLAELDHLFAADVKADDNRIQTALKELREIDAHLYDAEADMLRQMGEKGLPYKPYHGMRGHRGGCPCQGGNGMGYGGRGMRGYGPCAGYGMRGNAPWPGYGCNM
ncbi:MAG: hypothetical protein J5861_01620 [Desulfovibrio sp.]|nr:hypothetical protein [Desulfovibrio sp.]